MAEIRPMTAGDLGFAAELTAGEGWASGRSDFKLYLEHDPDGCFVAWDGGRPVGIVTTTRYTASAWIGNLIVVPEHRSRGLGRALMEHGLRHLESAGIRTVRLDGDPPGIPLYRSLGFVDEWESLRFRGVGGGLDRPLKVREQQGDDLAALDRTGSGGGLQRPPQVRDLKPDDLGAVAALDRTVFGDDRSRMLRLFFGRAEQALVVAGSDNLAGYAMVVRTDRGLRFGPWVAVDARAAEELLRGAVTIAVAGEAITLGVPGPNPEARSILERLGFEPTPSSLRMVRGPAAAAGRLDRIFAISNGAVG
jgi:ribosomal protein S18 acetylase RimI-like enzyme